MLSHITPSGFFFRFCGLRCVDDAGAPLPSTLSGRGEYRPAPRRLDDRCRSTPRSLLQPRAGHAFQALGIEDLRRQGSCEASTTKPGVTTKPLKRPIKRWPGPRCGPCLTVPLGVLMMMPTLLAQRWADGTLTDMNSAVQLYEALTSAPDDRTRARLIAEAFERLEERYPHLPDLATQGHPAQDGAAVAKGDRAGCAPS